MVQYFNEVCCDLRENSPHDGKSLSVYNPVIDGHINISGMQKCYNASPKPGALVH